MIEKSNSKYSKWYALYSFIILFVGLIFSIFSIDYYQHTIIEFGIIVCIFFIFAIIMMLFHKLIDRSLSRNKSDIYSIGIGYGLIFCFLLLFLNDEFKDDKPNIITCKILEKGLLPSNRGCQEPYVEYLYKGKLKRLDFYCKFQDEVKSANWIRLIAYKGYFNFEIFEDEKLLVSLENIDKI